LPRKVIDRIKDKIRNGLYDLTRHANDEMAEDNLDIAEVECSILNGKILKVEKDDPRGTKYTVCGTADQEILVGTVGRITETGRYLIVTVYEITEKE
jgi:uncharacterized protein DUF4258